MCYIMYCIKILRNKHCFEIQPFSIMNIYRYYFSQSQVLYDAHPIQAKHQYFTKFD